MREYYCKVNETEFYDRTLQLNDWLTVGDTLRILQDIQDDYKDTSIPILSYIIARSYAMGRKDERSAK